MCLRLKNVLKDVAGQSGLAPSNVAHPLARCLKGAWEDAGDYLEIARGAQGPLEES